MSKYGVREICEVVLKAKATQQVGKKTFYKDEPVCYFDTLKTTSLEGASSTVYAQGGRGNARLIAWDGERTLTFNMEDALISPIGFMILSGAGLTDASTDAPIFMHKTEQTGGNKVVLDTSIANEATVTITLSEAPAIPNARAGSEDFIYVMPLTNGEVTTEPYIASIVTGADATGKEIIIKQKNSTVNGRSYKAEELLRDFSDGCYVLVDYYVSKTAGAYQVDIRPDQFGGNYYLEADTLWRDTAGVDHPAQFIIPNCKVQSNFTFSMAATGDPSSFNFVLDAFPDYTRFDQSHKVLAAIQVLDESEAVVAERRPKTNMYDYPPDPTV